MNENDLQEITVRCFSVSKNASKMEEFFDEGGTLFCNICCEVIPHLRQGILIS